MIGFLVTVALAALGLWVLWILFLIVMYPICALIDWFERRAENRRLRLR